MTDTAPDPDGTNEIPPEPEPAKPEPKKRPAKKAAKKTTKKAAAKKPPAPKTDPDEVPRKSTSRPVGRPKKLTIESWTLQRIEQMASFGLLAAEMRRDQTLAYDMRVVLYQSKPLAREIAAKVEASPRLKASFERMMEAGDSVGLLAVVLGTAVPILAAHGIVPTAAVPLAAQRLTAEIGLPPERPKPDPKPEPARPAPPVSAEDVIDTVQVPETDDSEPSPQQAEVLARLEAQGLA